MHYLGVQNKFRRRRAVAYLACALFLILADILFWTRIAWAAPAYTPYANSVAGQSGLGSGTASRAVGAPDGQSASLLGLNSRLTLDMGEGEEGTNALKVYFAAINLQAQVRLEFLDGSQSVIKAETRSLFAELSASNQTFVYDWRDYKKAYRFVRITVTAAVAIGIDSVEALGFIGSSPTQDTDGDGKPDREDGKPLVSDPKPSDDDKNDDKNSSNSHSRRTTTIVRTSTSSNSGSTPVKNSPPSAADDKDGDQMKDDWETKHNLDPTDKSDAAQDPDQDGVYNLKEYQFDTNPRSKDTDGDGMPDGWELDSGLNAKKDDAVQDPDGDYLTNLGEYHFDTNPYRADDISQLASKLNKSERLWSWVIFALLLALALWCLWRARQAWSKKVSSGSSKKAKKSGKSSLPPL